MKLAAHPLTRPLRNDPHLETDPYIYNAGGPERIRENAVRYTDPTVLATYGGGHEFPLYFGEFADNGNYLETDEIAARHHVCGDPKQVGGSV